MAGKATKRSQVVLRRLVAFVAPLALAGCGGGEEATTTGPSEPPPLTKREFIDEADRICLAGDSQIEAIGDDIYAGLKRDEQPDPAEVRRFALKVVVPRIESEVEAIRALGAPPGDEREVEAILRATEQGVRQIESDPEGLAEGPPSGLQRAGDLSRRYGSEECGVE